MAIVTGSAPGGADRRLGALGCLEIARPCQAVGNKGRFERDARTVAHSSSSARGRLSICRGRLIAGGGPQRGAGRGLSDKGEQEAGGEGIAGAGGVGGGYRLRRNHELAIAPAARDAAAGRPELGHGERRQLAEWPPKDFRLVLIGEDNLGLDRSDRLPGRLRAGPAQRLGGRQVDRDDRRLGMRVAGSGEGRLAQRPVEQRVGRQVEHVGAMEPCPLDVGRAQIVCRAAAGNERTLAVGGQLHDQPSRLRPMHNGRPVADAVAAKRPAKAASNFIVGDGANELCSAAESGKRARRVGG